MNTVSFVFQDAKLLKTSILENVRMAKPGASKAEVTAALHAAQCVDIIAKMPNGVDTVVGTAGVYPVSYTHLDVYKRQLLLWATNVCRLS